MKTTHLIAASVAASALALTGCTATTDDGEAGEWPEELVLGLVPSQEVDQLVEDAQVLGDLLAEELGIPVTTTVTDNYAGLVVAMQTDQAQIGMFGPIALVQAVDQADAVPILQSIRFGSAAYHTQWFTNDPARFCTISDPVTVEDEGVEFAFCNGTDTAEEGPVGEEALANLEAGETISFVDELSASGYYYPATQLENAGLDPFSDITPLFAGGHPNSVQTVARGDAAVGVSFDDARTGLVEEDPTIGTTVTVFAWSTQIPNDGIAVGGSLPQDLVDAITDAFLALTETDEGLAALDAVYEIEGLVPADLEALDAARQVEANFGE